MNFEMKVTKRFHLIAAIIAAFLIIDIHGGEFKTIETSDGGVKGVKKTTEYKKVDYFAFRGIPYAEKPTGDLRFKAPKPKKSWKPKVLDALEFGNTCFQLEESMINPYPQSEDCLFLNIYVPANATETQKLPVLFFIHGGSYAEGSGNDDFYSPEFIIEKNVILVTINYRLAIFGFLSLSLPEYSGNMGLKDQQLALQWVNKNIGHFNGDNTKIMVFGESAGATSVHHQLLSSESRKYFQNAILMSGSALQYWAMTENNDHLEIANKIAKDAGKTFENTKDLAKFLVSQPPQTLIKYSAITPLITDRLDLAPFTPVIEVPNAKKPFMTKSIEELYKTEDIRVNTMFTFTSAEFLVMIVKDLPKMFDIEGLNTNFSLPLPFRSLKLSNDSEEYRAINKEIRQFYFGNDVIDKSKMVEYVNLLSDLNACYGIDKAAKLHALKSKGKTYYGRFDVDSKLNIIKRARAEVEVPGACHGDDVCYLFKLRAGRPFYDSVFGNQNDEESKISLQTIDYMTDLFTNFAKLDHAGISPSLGFKPIQNGQINFLDISNNGLKPGLNPNGKAMELWANIEKKLQQFIDNKEQS